MSVSGDQMELREEEVVAHYEAAVAMLLWGEPPRLELTSLGPRQLELQQQVAVQPLH